MAPPTGSPLARMQRLFSSDPETLSPSELRISRQRLHESTGTSGRNLEPVAIMEEHPNGGVGLDSSLTERQETDDGRRREITNREIQIISDPAQEGAEVEEAAEVQKYDGSLQSREDHDNKTNLVQVLPANELSVYEDVESAEDNVKPAEEDVKPVEDNVKPAEDNMKPTEEDVKPAEDNVKPTEEDVRPAEDNVKPTEDNMKPTEDNVKPAEEDVRPAEEDVKPVEDNVKPAEEDMRPAEEDVKHVEDNVKPAEDIVQPAEDIVKPAEDNMKPTEENVRPAEEDVRPAEDNWKPAEEDMRPAEEDVKPVEDNMKPTEDNVKPAEEDVRPAEDIVKPAEDNMKPTEENVKPAEEDVRPAEDNWKPAEEDMRPAEEDVKHIEDNVKPAEDIVQPAEDIVKPAEDSVKPAEEDVMNCSAAPSSFCGDPVVQDHHGRQRMDLLHVTKRDNSQPPNVPQDTETGVDSSSQITESSKEKMYQSVLHQMLQQQKHKPGRRFKKKTLMKMARLFVIAKGLEGGPDKDSGSTDSWNPAGDQSMSQSRKQTPEDGHDETFPPTCSAQTETFNKNNKQSENPESDCKEPRNDCESTDTQSGLKLTSEERNRVSRIRSRVRSESRGKPPTQTSKRRKRAAKRLKAGVKIRDSSAQTSESADKSEEETSRNINVDLRGGGVSELERQKKNRTKNQVETSEGGEPAASTGGNKRKRRSSVRRLQSAEVKGQSDLFLLTAADEVTSSQDRDCAGRVAGQKPRQKVKNSRTSRRSRKAANVSLQEPNQTDLNQAPPPNVASVTQSKRQKPGKRAAKKPRAAATVWDYRATDQFVSADTFLQSERINSKTPRKRSAQGRRREENRGTFSVKQEEDEQTISSVNDETRPKRRGRRKKLKSDSHLHIKKEPVLEAGTDQLVSYRKRKHLEEDKTRSDEVMKITAAGDEARSNMETISSSLHGLTNQKRRRKVVKPGLPNSEETSEGPESKNIKQERGTSSRLEVKDGTGEPEECLRSYLKAPQKRCYTKRRRKKRMKVKSAAKKTFIPDQNLQVPNLQDPNRIENNQQLTSETTSPEITTEIKQTKRGRKGNRVGLVGSSEKLKRKRGTQKLLSESDETEAPSSSHLNQHDGVTVIRKKRGRKPKRVDQKPDPASEAQTGPGPGSSLPQTEGGTSDPKQTDSLDVDSEETTTSRTKGRKNSRASKNETLTSWKILRSKDQLYKQETGAPEQEDTQKTSTVRRRRRRDVSTVQLGDAASPAMDAEAVQNSPVEPETSTSLRQDKSNTMETVSSAAPTETRMKRRGRRRKTHRGKKKVERPQISSLCEDPVFTVPEPKTCRSRQKDKKDLRCSFCLQSFRHISALTLHKRIHTGEKPYRCSICVKRFSKFSQLNLHSKVHDKPPAVICPCCGGTFKNKTELLLHFKVHLDAAETFQTESQDQVCSDPTPRSFRCSVCSKEFTKTSTFKMHQRRHDRKLLRRRAAFRRSSLNEAASSNGGRTEVRGFVVSQGEDADVVTPLFFKCPLCKQLHRRWCHYVLHLHSHTSARSHRCDACGQQYDQAANTMRHCSSCCRRSGEETACRGSLSDVWKEAGAPEEERVHPQTEQEEETLRFPQEEPGERQMFPQEEPGERQMFPQEEPGERQMFPPPSPSESAPSMMDDFDNDVPSPSSSFLPATSPTAGRRSAFGLQPLRLSRRFLCGRCGRSFTQWNKLWLHQRLHQRTSRAFSCSRCELEFHFLGSYVHHLQEHAAQTPHACPSCPDTFADETDLNTHVTNCHKQQEGLRCNTCGKRFSVQINLKKHTLLHRGGKSHACLPCGRKFSCHTDLKTHLQTHRKRLSVPRPARMEEPLLFPYHCRKCSASFSSPDLLQAHQVRHFIAGRESESSERLAFYTSNIPTVTEESPPLKQLPVSNKKHLFRYPHPDRLYVVPIVSSEPPVVISDEEEETSDSHREHGDGLEPADSEHQLELLVKSLIPEKCVTDSSNCEGDAPEQTPKRHAQNCALCSETFTDITTLHEHYRDHARGV